LQFKESVGIDMHGRLERTRSHGGKILQWRGGRLARAAGALGTCLRTCAGCRFPCCSRPGCRALGSNFLGCSGLGCSRLGCSSLGRNRSRSGADGPIGSHGSLEAGEMTRCLKGEQGTHPGWMRYCRSASIACPTPFWVGAEHPSRRGRSFLRRTDKPTAHHACISSQSPGFTWWS